MPAYYYHLAFELTNKSSPDDQPPFLPAPDLDVFSSALPSHKSSTWASYLAPRRHRRSQTGDFDRKTTRSAQQQSHLPTRLPSPTRVRARDQTQRDETSVATPLTDTKRLETKPFGCANDYRFDQLVIESIDMESHTISALERQQIAEATQATLESSKSFALGLKGRYIPSDPKTTEIGWGVVHLYREELQAPELDNAAWTDDRSLSVKGDGKEESRTTEADCTTLCILAVPSYMTPSDLLGWLGEETRELVSHFRLVRTSRSNRYMVLLKFRESSAAKRWQKDWNSRLFNSMEVCILLLLSI